MEIAPFVAVETGVDAQAVQAALESWLVPVLVGGAVTFAIGALAFANAVAHSGVLSPKSTAIVVLALIVMAV